MTPEELSNPVEVAFAHFEQKALSAAAPREQRVEMRKAFYVGFAAALGFFQSLGADDGLEEDDAVTLLMRTQEQIARTVDAMGPPRPDPAMQNLASRITPEQAEQVLRNILAGVVEGHLAARADPGIDTIQLGVPTDQAHLLILALGRAITALPHTY